MSKRERRNSLPNIRDIKLANVLSQQRGTLFNLLAKRSPRQADQLSKRSTGIPLVILVAGSEADNVVSSLRSAAEGYCELDARRFGGLGDVVSLLEQCAAKGATATRALVSSVDAFVLCQTHNAAPSEARNFLMKIRCSPHAGDAAVVLLSPSALACVDALAQSRVLWLPAPPLSAANATAVVRAAHQPVFRGHPRAACLIQSVCKVLFV